MNAPGRGLLKVSGILLIIYGAIILLLGILAMIGMFIPGVMAAAAVQAGVSVVMVMLSAVIVLIMGALYLVAGILGVKNSDKPEKAQACFVVGVLMVLVVVVNSIMSAVGGTLKWYSVIIGLVLSVLYLLGALKNKEVSSTGVAGGSIIDQAKDAFGDAHADIKSGAIVDEAKAAVSDAVGGAKEISDEVVDKVIDTIDGDDK